MKSKFLVSLLSLFLVPAASAATYAENINGELSRIHTSPTSFGLDLGSNRLSGSLTGNGIDIDLFTLTVPADAAITEIRIIEFSGGGPSGSFLGFQPGSTLDAPPATAFAGGPIGYAIISPSNAAVDADVLGTITGGGLPFSGATSLPTGQYAGWLNETGAGSTYTIDFVVSAVPEPSSGLLGLIGMALAVTRRKRG
ncbi:PEP-CTERM sorting domain-containing protein [Haloferula sp.]|uniref:PEP-CTERM sorting domain-containing protein n=1 Tax=Haloferula sp. TaxID=2497595 RepID=UPI00329F1B4E